MEIQLFEEQTLSRLAVGNRLVVVCNECFCSLVGSCHLGGSSQIKFYATHILMEVVKMSVLQFIKTLGSSSFKSGIDGSSESVGTNAGREGLAIGAIIIGHAGEQHNDFIGIGYMYAFFVRGYGSTFANGDYAECGVVKQQVGLASETSLIAVVFRSRCIDAIACIITDLEGEFFALRSYIVGYYDIVGLRGKVTTGISIAVSIRKINTSNTILNVEPASILREGGEII